MSEGLLIVVSGPSGAGKGTICKQLLMQNDGINMSISATTRDPRTGEAEGVNYSFIDKKVFENMIENNEFLEYAYVYGNYYGTPRKYVFDNINEGKDILLEIDIQGALKVKDMYPYGVYIFILPPSMDELKNRITNRGTESEEAITERFQSASKELEYVFKYDYAVLNDEISLATKKIEAIIIAEKCKVNRQKEIITRI